MKKFIAALTLAALATCAQAVAIKWQTGADDSVYNGDNAKLVGDVVAGGKSIESSSFAMVVNFTGAVTGTNHHMADFGLWDQGHIYANSYANNQDLGFNKGNLWSQPPVDIVQGSSFVFTMTIEKLSDTTSKVLCYIDGKLVMTIDNIAGLNGFNASTFAGDGYTITSTAAYDGVLSTDDIDKIVASGNAAGAVPEPTALALLLMGVAAVGLRRKARAA